MKILDKYIIKKILMTFFYVVVLLLTIITVFDLAENMDKYSKHMLSFKEIFIHYTNFIPWIGGLLIPITSFIAVVYVTAWLSSHSEIIAMLCGGMSYRRFLLSYFMAVSVIAMLSFVLNGWIIPHSNRELLNFKMRYLTSRTYYDARNIHIQSNPNVYLYLQNYNNQTNTGYQFTLEKFEDNRLVEKMEAEYIQWDSVVKKWQLHHWKHKYVDTLFSKPSTLQNTRHDQDNELGLLNDKLIFNTSSNSTQGEKLDTVLVILPEDFLNEDREFDGMTLPELNRHINKLRFRGSAEVPAYEVQWHIRYSSPFTIYILAFMGAILSSRKSRGDTGFQIALAFLLSFIFIVFFMFSSTLASTGSLPPMLAAWLPNISFALITILLYKFVPR